MLAIGAALALVLPITGSAAASVPRAQSLEGEQIEVAAVWTGAEQKNFKRVLDAFTKQTGVEVTFTSTGDDISSVLEPRIAGGDAPDVAILPQPGLLEGLRARGALKPVEDAAGSAGRPALLADLAHARHRRQHAYGVWVKGANKSLVWYNANVFDDAGVKPAKSFDDLHDVDADDLRLRRAAALDRCRRTAGRSPTSSRTSTSRRPAPDKYDQLDLAPDPLDRPVGQGSAARPWRSLVKSDWLPGGTSDTLQTEFPESVQNMFSNPPKAAMEIEGDFVGAAITGDTKAKVGTDAKLFSFPPIDER